MAEQLEFDLVSVHLSGPSLEEQRLLDEAAELMGQGKEKLRLAKLAAELHNLDLVLEPKSTDELAQLRLLVGNTVWKKTRRRWERRLKQNVREVRKLIVVLRSLFNP